MNKMIKKIPWENKITFIQSNVMEHLARYKFLTLSQMLALDIGTTQYQYLWKQVMSIRDRKNPLVGCHSFGIPQPQKGKVESMYYLTPLGKRILIEDFEFIDRIKMPIGKTAAYRDYFHRKYTIDFQIALDKWANENGVIIPYFDTYFDKVGNNRKDKSLRAKTKIGEGDNDYFIPDGVFDVTIEDVKRFYLFEMYNGVDTGRTIKQLTKHAHALVERKTHTKYKLDRKKSYNIVLVFEFDSMMKAVIKRISSDERFKFIEKYFLCKSLDQVRAGDFYNNWTTLSGKKSDFLGVA